MKRVIARMILLLFLLTGCEPANVINTTEESITEKTTENMLPVDVLEDVQYVWWGSGRHEIGLGLVSAEVISSEKEMKNSICATECGAAGFLSSYGQAYFDKGYLLILEMVEPSGSIRHEITEAVMHPDGKLSVEVKRLVPECGTDDVAGWYIVIELSREQGVANGSDVLLYVDGKLAKNVTSVQDTRLQAYNGQWLDKETAQKQGALPVSDVVITQIYADCFLARSVLALPYQFKFNGSLSEDWCVGDQVTVTGENVWYDQEAMRYEADFLTVRQSQFEMQEIVLYKPVIYLYPEKETEVSVKLTVDGGLTCTYPAYGNGWLVTATPDGTLTDRNGQTYNYLYWEGKTNTRWDMTRGFCVRGEDTAVFLEQALARLGLNRREANEFIIYWLPQMEQNPYNIISFQGEDYTDAAALEVDPAPDTVIRVFMTWQAVENYVQIEPQELTAPERTGFTLVEWGGTELS